MIINTQNIASLKSTKRPNENSLKDDEKISKVLSKSNHSLKSNSLKIFSSKIFRKISQNKLSNNLSVTNLPISKSVKSSNVVFNISECNANGSNFNDTDLTKIIGLKRSQSDSSRQNIEKSVKNQVESDNQFFCENPNSLFPQNPTVLDSESNKNVAITNSNSSFNNSLDSLLMNMDKVPSVPNMKAILSQYPEYQVTIDKTNGVCCNIVLITLVVVVLGGID